MEKWKEINQDIIPKGEYITDLRYGEDHGLIVTLVNHQFSITLDFGVVVSIQSIDEGVMITPPYADEPFSLYWNKHFDTILYQIENSSYHEYIHQITKTLYKKKELRHYLLVTLNYFINIISIWGIDIYVEDLKTHEEKHFRVK